MPAFVALFLGIELIFVSYLDFKNKIISNKWVLLNLIFFCILLFFFKRTYLLKAETFILPISFLFVGFCLYLLKIMGAGDSKYLFSIFLLIPLEHHERMFLCLAYSTIIVGLNLLFINILKNSDRIKKAVEEHNVEEIKKIFGKKFSYAPVIFISIIWFVWQIRREIHI